jgi:hypothetical protein
MVHPTNEGDVACDFEGIRPVAESAYRSVGEAEWHARFGG